MKIGMVSLGCPKNLVDSEVMLGLAQQEGHRLTRDAAEADVLVVNTCAFIDKAKQESIDTILEMAEHKKTGKCQRAGRHRLHGGAVSRRAARADPGDRRGARNRRDSGDRECDRVRRVYRARPALHCLESDVAAAAPSNGEPSALSDGDLAEPKPRTSPDYLYDAETPRLLATPRHYAYIKIAEGCDYKCAFCIIPTLRGKYRSRSIDSVVQRGEATRRIAA